MDDDYDDDYGFPKLAQSDISMMIPMTMPMPMIRRWGNPDGKKTY